MRADVAVIGPFHDAERHVDGWLERLAAQTDRGFHLYLVDDASSDGTVSALRRGVAEHGLSADVLALPENVGPAAARNVAIRRALADRARLILLLDSDCLVERDWIARHAAFHREHPDVGVMGGGILGTAATAVGRADGFCSWFTAIPGARNGPVRRLHLPSTNMSIKRSVFDVAGFFDETLATGEDVAFCRAVQTHGIVLWFQSDVVILHQDRERWPDALRHHYRWGLHSVALSMQTHGGYYGLLTRMRSRWVVASLVPAIAAANVVLILCRYTRRRPAVWLFIPWIAALRWRNAVGVYHGWLDPDRSRRLADERRAVAL